MIENNNEKRNKKITIALVVLILLLVTIVGITYAYFSAKSNAEKQPITTAKVDLLVEVNPEATHVKDIKPTTWNETTSQNDDNEDVVKIPIKVTNRSTIDINYDLFITPNGLALNEEDTDGDEQPLVGGNLADIKYKLYEKTGDTLSEKPITEGDFTDGEAKQKIVGNKEIKAQKEGNSDNIQNYILYIYIENKTSAQNKLQGIDFNLDIEGVTPAEKPKLSEAILDSEEIITKAPEFTTSSQDRGLFKLQDNSAIAASISSEDSNSNNKGSIYYYRGSVENNYVQLGTYPKDVINKINNDSGEEDDVKVANSGDPILWRIMRINSDNTITMILEHNIGNSWHVWNSRNKPNYINTDGSDSNIKKTVDDWYKEIFGETSNDETNKLLDNYVVKSKFCNDRRNVVEPVLEQSEAYSRIKSTPPNPSLSCTPDDEVESKIGLVTTDELVYAGALFNISNSNNNTTYINNNTWFWTITPCGFNNVFNWNPINLYISFGASWGSPLDSSDACAARPVITLAADAPFTVDETKEDAPGSEKNPYKITAE